MNQEIKSFLSFVKMSLLFAAGCLILAALYVVVKLAVYLMAIVA